MTTENVHFIITGTIKTDLEERENYHDSVTEAAGGLCLHNSHMQFLNEYIRYLLEQNAAHLVLNSEKLTVIAIGDEELAESVLEEGTIANVMATMAVDIGEIHEFVTNYDGDE